MNTYETEDDSKEENENNGELIYNLPYDNFFDDPSKSLKSFATKKKENFSMLITDKNNYNLGINENIRNELEDLYEENVRLKKRLLNLKMKEKDIKCITDILQDKLSEIYPDMVDIKEELQPLHSQCQQIVTDIKLKVEKTKEAHNSFKYATRYYKNLLGINIKVDKNNKSVIVKVDFVKINGNNKNYSATLRKMLSTNSWSLESIKPEITVEQFFNLQNQLASDNNIAFTLRNIRKIFKLI